MTTVRPSSDGSGFLQDTAGIEMAPAFSTADGHTSCDDAGQGGFAGVPVITITHSAVIRRTARPSTKTTVVTPI